MKKKLMVIAVIVVFFAGILICYNESLDYIKTVDYSLVEKYGNYYDANKDSLVKELFSEDGMVIYDYYSDYVVIYLKQANGRIRFSRIQFCTNEYSFGNKKITIGTSKAIVEKSLRNSKKCGISDNYMCNENGEIINLPTYEYIDKDNLEYGIAVAYDEDDKVCYIALWNGGLN